MKNSNVKYAPRFQPKFKVPSAPSNRRNPVKKGITPTRGASNAASPELPVVKPPNGTANRKSKSNADPPKDVTSRVSARHRNARGHRRKNQPLTEALPSIAESDEDRTIEDILQTADITTEQGQSVDAGIVPWSIFGDSQPEDSQPRKNQDLPSKVFEFPASPGRKKQKSRGKKERERKIKSNLLRTILKTCNEIKKIKERRQKLLGAENRNQVTSFVQSTSIPVTVSTAARISINSKYQVAPSSSVEEESFGMTSVNLGKKLQTAVTVSQAFMTEE
ncbi:Hypp1858 [Branchiostoma lanceolatum]|uniref:Hypp1858 protein n=1 Tax=Branchiostoma lanceolatum TaxID=7740 RepID=A0A8K0EMN1_BRALA|nr:Hypp1858 [Branchiostoma lanceolatum]